MIVSVSAPAGIQGRDRGAGGEGGLILEPPVTNGSPAMPPKRFWTELTWTDFQAGNTANWIAVLPVAAVAAAWAASAVGVDAFIGEAI